MPNKAEMQNLKDVKNYLNRTRGKGFKLTLKDVMGMSEQALDQIMTEMAGGDRYNKGGLVKKNYCNPVTIVDKRKKK